MSQRNPKKRPQSNKARDYKQHFDDIIKRKTGTIDLATRILIVCEDGKSAINYFKALKRLMGLSAVSPVVKPNKDGQTQPEQVVAHARQLMAQALDSGTEPFDLVWCVIDGDFGPKVTRCRPTADSSHIQLAISTPCFELWVLLHHQDHGTAAYRCGDIVSLLKKAQPRYEKGSFDFTPTVRNVLDAYERARRLRNESAFRLPEEQNPSSDLYKLIEELFLAWGKSCNPRRLTGDQAALHARARTLIKRFA